MKSFVLMFLRAAVVALAGCSGSSVTPPPPPPSAEHIYVTSRSAGTLGRTSA